MTSLQNTGCWCLSHWLSSFFYISTLNISWTLLQSLLTILFSERTLRSFRCIEIFAQTVSNFLPPSAENTKKEASFDILMTITLRSKLDKGPHFFYLLFELYPLVYFISAFFQDLQNSIPCGPPSLHFVLVCKIPWQRWNFQAC